MSIDVLVRSSTSDLATVPRGRRRRGWAMGGVCLAASAAMAAWLPFVDRPLSPDEGGFLLLAQQWHPGSSLYGSYWVDRPPLLLWLFDLAHHWGPPGDSSDGMTAPAVKLMGAAASGLAVLLTGVVASLLAPHHPWPRRGAVITAGALLSSPLLGMPETDGEVLAVPFVLAGIVCLVAAARRDWDARTAVLTAAAGASAVCAALIKQNMVDVFVFALVLLVVSRPALPRWGIRVGVFVTSSFSVLLVALAAAAARGTTPAGLWDAIVVFRFQATAVIRASSSEATPGRMSLLVLAALASGVALLAVFCTVVLLAERARRRPVVGSAANPDVLHSALTWSALAMLAWELCGVALGGSYWLHYLTGLVPGVVLLMALVRPSGRGRALLAACVVYVVVASAAVWVHQADAPAELSDEARVVHFLRGHASRSDAVVVGFGHAEIVAGSGLSSPYEHLWSLPVRVRDPSLRELSHVMKSADSPRWVVVAGGSLDSWGLDPQAAQQILTRHYVERVAYGDWHIWQHEEGNVR
ncbi:MAG: hypothetical protein ABIS91_12260 [Nocardioides sp.]|uniref:hypothetical protein n=1 Tax=Nocardioides sp. TaxID=35761 RepID=UPI0032659263